MKIYSIGYRKVFRLAMVCILLFVLPCLASNSITIYTPNHTEITGYLPNELSIEQIEQKDQQWQEIIQQNGWNAEKIKPSSGRYNCHGYAWHMSLGGNPVEIEGREVPKYWKDGSYKQIKKNEAVEGDIIFMTDPNRPNSFHSAIVSNTPGWCKSKWADGPVYLHMFEDHPFGKTLKFFRKVAPAAPKNLRIVLPKTFE